MGRSCVVTPVRGCGSRCVSDGVSSGDVRAWSAIFSRDWGQSSLPRSCLVFELGLGLPCELGVPLLDLIVIVGDRVNEKGFRVLLATYSVLSRLLGLG